MSKKVQFCSIMLASLIMQEDVKMSMMNSKRRILLYISAARKTSDFDKRVEILQKLNASLPEETRLMLPSMFTHAYVRRALETIEDKTRDSIVA